MVRSLETSDSALQGLKGLKSLISGFGIANPEQGVCYVAMW